MNYVITLKYTCICLWLIWTYIVNRLNNRLRNDAIHMKEYEELPCCLYKCNIKYNHGCYLVYMGILTHIILFAFILDTFLHPIRQGKHYYNSSRQILQYLAFCISWRTSVSNNLLMMWLLYKWQSLYGPIMTMSRMDIITTIAISYNSGRS
jgi:hypothetical protein